MSSDAEPLPASTSVPATASTFIHQLQLAAERRAAAGLTRRLQPRPAESALIDLAGNDYLGLSRDQRIITAATAAVQAWGAGANASRLVTGTTTLHEDLEHALAEFCDQPTALTFSSGYLANLGVVGALAGPDVLIVSDAHIHASLIDACRLSRSRVQVVAHHDLAAVEDALRNRSETRALVLCESIYSVLGDVAPLLELARVCREQDAVLIVDEAHALGVAGVTPAGPGRGLVAGLGLAGRSEVIVTATLSKALGSQGGVVLGHPAVREQIINQARPFIFDTGLAPVAAAAALAAVQVITDQPERVAALIACVTALADRLGVPVPAGAVLTVPAAGPEQAMAAAQHCADAGVRVGCFRPPSVPDGVSRLRVTARATLTGSDLDRALTVLGELDPANPPAAAPTAASLRTSSPAESGRASGPQVVMVTGTSTDVGKTMVTAALAATLSARRVALVKPAQTGLAPHERGDVHQAGRLAGIDDLHELARFADPLAPQTAARRSITLQDSALRDTKQQHTDQRPEAHLPDVADHAQTIMALAGDHDLVLVEGAGGVLVRLDLAGHTLADLALTVAAAGVRTAMVVVASAGLGTLNHSELTVRFLQQQGIDVLGIVIGSWPAEPGLAEYCNLADLPRLTGVPLLGVLPAGAGALDPVTFRGQAPSWFTPAVGGSCRDMPLPWSQPSPDQ